MVLSIQTKVSDEHPVNSRTRRRYGEMKVTDMERNCRREGWEDHDREVCVCVCVCQRTAFKSGFSPFLRSEHWTQTIRYVAKHHQPGKPAFSDLTYKSPVRVLEYHSSAGSPWVPPTQVPEPDVGGKSEQGCSGTKPHLFFCRQWLKVMLRTSSF